MAANFRRYAAAAWALLLGFGMWAGSRFVVGTLEPWDAEWPFYLVIMLAGGAAIGVALPRQTVPMFLGLWAGQALGLLPVSYTHLDVYKRQPAIPSTCWRSPA